MAREFTEGAECPGCGKPMWLKFEFTAHPVLYCATRECEANTMNCIFPPSGSPQRSVEDLCTQWAGLAGRRNMFD